MLTEDLTRSSDQSPSIHLGLISNTPCSHNSPHPPILQMAAYLAAHSAMLSCRGRKWTGWNGGKAIWPILCHSFGTPGQDGFGVNVTVQSCRCYQPRLFLAGRSPGAQLGVRMVTQAWGGFFSIFTCVTVERCMPSCCSVSPLQTSFILSQFNALLNLLSDPLKPFGVTSAIWPLCAITLEPFVRSGNPLSQS